MEFVREYRESRWAGLSQVKTLNYEYTTE
jgi:hypothetical protein